MLYTHSLYFSISQVSTYAFKSIHSSTLPPLHELAIIITIPDSYDLISLPDFLTCSTIAASSKPIACEIYNQFILIKERSTIINKLLEGMIINSLINPSYETLCSQIIKQFVVKVIDLANNSIILTSKVNSSSQTEIH